MENSFADVMQSRTDLQLVEILTFDKYQYIPEAISAAEQEAEFRNLDVYALKNIIEESRNTVQEKQPYISIKKAYITVLLIFLFPILLLVFSCFKEEIYGIFIVPFILLCFFICGLIGTILAVKTYKKHTHEGPSLNKVIGTILILFGAIMCFAGLMFILLAIALLSEQ